MGSSTGKKHKKEKKHKHRSHSKSRSSDEVNVIDRHHTKPRSVRHFEENTNLVTIEVDENVERRHKHKHKKHKEHKERHKHHKRNRDERDREVLPYEEGFVIAVEGSESDSSDCVEVPVDVPPPPIINKASDRGRELDLPAPILVSKHLEHERRDREKERDREREREREFKEKERDKEREREREKEIRERERYEKERERYEKEREIDRRRERDLEKERIERDQWDRERDRERHHHHHDRRAREKERSRSKSPLPENGAGDCLSIEETNKLRAKLGLKPLEVDTGPTQSSSSAAAIEARKGLSNAEKDLSSYKDEWGEFLHKPAANLKEKAAAEKMREKLSQRKEKRFVEQRLAQIRTLGESDDEVDDVSKWVQRNKRVVDIKKEAEKRAKALEEMDAEFGVGDLIETDKEESRRKAYSDKHLKGLRVEHDMEDFSEGKTVILTLKDKGVLDEEEGDALVNVNMIDDERYRKNVQNKKQNPLSYGYNVYEEQYDHFGNPIERGILEKYDEDVDGRPTKKKNFVLGENIEEEREHRRKILEIKTKLAGKRLETLADTKIQLASDTLSEAELAKFKKPKKKVKKMRQRLKAEDLLPLAAEPTMQHFGSRRGRNRNADDEDNDQENSNDFYTQVKLEDDEEDLERVLSKARKLKQKENIIQKPMNLDLESIKQEVKIDSPGSDEENASRAEGNIILNATAEFCRTLGDIPTYGMAGNRDEDSNDMMDYELNDVAGDEHPNAKNDEVEASTGTWNSVNPEDVIRPMELDEAIEDVEEVAILDEEPDVGAGVANALRLALSKGYLEKEEHNRPSNSKMAHLQAKNYSIEDKAQGEDDKFGRRDRFHAGPIMDFRDKDSFKPNVKLEYIDDNGRILNSKEAFRYLSHKFHGKGPGKNKIEKRLKKMEQEGLMKTMSSTDTPLGTLTMLQQKQKETKAPYVILSGGKQTAASVGNTTISKYK